MLPVSVEDVALIVVFPLFIAVANPLEPAALLMVATVVSEESQVDDAVKSCVVVSE